MSTKKQYLKDKPVCKVTFKVGKEVTNGSYKVQLVGDFNDWDTSRPPMKKLKTGEYSETISLEPGREYQYKYLIDDRIWENDIDADKYVPNSYAGTNSVVVL